MAGFEPRKPGLKYNAITTELRSNIPIKCPTQRAYKPRNNISNVVCIARRMYWHQQ